MTVHHTFMQSILLAGLCLGPLMTEAASLPQIQSVSIEGVGPERHSVVKRSESRTMVYQLQPEQIQRSILRILEQEMAGKVRAIHVAMVDPLDPMKIPSAGIGLRVSPKGVDEGLGRRAFHVQIIMNGEPWQTIEAIADVSASIDAVVPTRVLQIDSVIEGEDVTLHRIKLMDLDHQLITNVTDVIGKSAARPLQINNPIRLGMVKKPYAVRKGDRVSIEARRGGLSIQAVGVTKASGELGQFVTVANADSGKELRAKVVGPGVVRVEY
jgi:flagellar basal body P-ring formation protein FlgA